jgi:deferrochelatase/peroxidase EfeB
MQDNNYPGIRSYTEDKSYRPPLYSTREFEKLIHTTPLLDHDPEAFDSLLGDLQANILQHHQRNHTRCYFIHVNSGEDNAAMALEWISEVAQKVTSAKTQFEEIARVKKIRDEQKNAAQRGSKGSQPLSRAPIVCLYLSWKGYRRLNLEHFTPFDEQGSFEKGPRNNLASLFHENDSDPIEKHIMLMLASDVPDFSDITKDITDPSKEQWSSTTVQEGFLKRQPVVGKPGKEVSVDWFGYRDGISQPIFFPDCQDIRQADKNRLSPLRVVLTKDRGGKKRYSAGSFMAYLKIEQDEYEFSVMENNIALHTAAFALEALIGKKKISRIVRKSAIERVIEIDVAEKERLATNIQKIWPGARQIFADPAEAVHNLIQPGRIADFLAENEIGKLVSIRPDMKEDLLHEIDRIGKLVRKNEKTDAAVGALLDKFNEKIEFLQSEAEIALVNTRLIDLMIDELTGGQQISKPDKEILHEAIDKSFSLNAIEKRNFIENLSTSNLSLLTAKEVVTTIETQIHLAEAYIMGRFRDGTPVATSSSPQGYQKTPDDDFSYRKKLIGNDGSRLDDTQALRCPFGAHARKANPREDAQQRLIARRGVLYEDTRGNGSTIGHGMLFMSFQSSLANQFEYIIKNWINSVNYGQQMTGVDLLAGVGINREYSRWYFPVRWNNDDPEAKVKLTGRELPACLRYLEGDYFFAPSISFLQGLTQLQTLRGAQNPQPWGTKFVFDGYRIKQPIKILQDEEIRKSLEK